jgi:hypothetical protein
MNDSVRIKVAYSTKMALETANVTDKRKSKLVVRLRVV